MNYPFKVSRFNYNVYTVGLANTTPRPPLVTNRQSPPNAHYWLIHTHDRLIINSAQAISTSGKITHVTFKCRLMQVSCLIFLTHAAVFTDNSNGTPWILIMGLQPPEETSTACSLLMGMLVRCRQCGDRHQSWTETGGVCTCQVEKCCKAPSPGSVNPTMPRRYSDESDVRQRVTRYICIVLGWDMHSHLISTPRTLPMTVSDYLILLLSLLFKGTVFHFQKFDNNINLASKQTNYLTAVRKLWYV